MKEKNLERNEDDALFSNKSLKKLSKKYEPPFYVYSSNIIQNSYQKLEKSLPENFNIFYSVKANPNSSIIQALKKQGAGMEIASKGELMACKKLSIPGKKIVFAGPGKTEEEIREAIKYETHAINAESFNEIKKIDKIAKEENKKQKVHLRINPNIDISSDVVMGGKSKQFGIDEEKLPEIKEILKNCSNIEMKGIHVFSASQILDTEKFIENIEKALQLAKKSREFFKVKTIDIGSGLGITYNERGKKINMKKVKKEVNDLIKNSDFENTEFIMESGRFLVGESGIYLTKVLDKKESRGKKFLIVKGGINHLLRPSLIGINHPVINLTSKEALEKVNITGQLCTPLDVLAKDISIKKAQIGDLIAILKTGAYGYTESMPLFLSHKSPKEILIKDGKDEIIREEITYKDIFSKQKWN